MAVSSPIRDDHRWQLEQLAAAWHVASLPPLPLSSSTSSAYYTAPTTFRTPTDDSAAEELLRRHRQDAAQESKESRSGFRRALGGGGGDAKKTKDWTPQEIFSVLDQLVQSRGSPGVAEALVARLTAAGGDLNNAANNNNGVRNRSSMLFAKRRSSLDPLRERTRVLQTAATNRHHDMVAVLVRHADPASLDAALPAAMRAGDMPIVELLLRHGANAWRTSDGQDAFRQACIAGGQADLVGLVLQSDGRPAPNWISQSMADAARRGCRDTVLRLSRSAAADGGFNGAQALREAIAQCRVDIALAVLTGVNPPPPQAATDAFAALFTHASIMPNEKLALSQALLCAGAAGNAVSEALVQAAAAEFFEMVDMLVSFGASVEYRDATALRTAITKNQTRLVQALLSDTALLSRACASACVSHIPKNATAEDRRLILSALLRKGACGPPIHDTLIDAVESGDRATVSLLVNPFFTNNNPLPPGARRQSRERHDTASVDHRGGLALQIAVTAGDADMAKRLLAAKPSTETLAAVFAQIRDLQPAERFRMTECFLSAGVPGPCASQALQDALGESAARRDDRLIGLLLRHNADVNFNGGAGILAAVADRDVGLLETLLQSRPTAQIAAAGIAKAMDIDDRRARFDMINLLIGAGASPGCDEISVAMGKVLQDGPVDVTLLRLLLDRGNADVNFMQGAAVVSALRDSNPALVELVLQKGKPTQDTLVRALAVLADIPTDEPKARKAESVIRRTRSASSLHPLLDKEIRMLLLGAPETGQPNLAVARLLLSSGADVNFNRGSALCVAVRAASAPATDLLLSRRPSPATVAAALPHALKIQDPMDRLAFAKKLVGAGVPGSDANGALVHVLANYPDDISLVTVLAVRADLSGGEALESAVRQERDDVVEVLLRHAARNSVAQQQQLFSSKLADAARVQDRQKRLRICKLLLQVGASGTALSDALLAAASDGDLALGKLLVDGGASIEHQDAQAVVGACRSGSAEVLRMLLGSRGEIKQDVLARGFQAATDVGDLATRADVFRVLLEKGVSGEVVDAQLVSAVRYGDDGTQLLRLLLEFGADPDYNSGEAAWTATRNATMGSLALILSVVSAGGRHRKPSPATLAKTLKASWRLSRDPRFQVVEWVFAAGHRVSQEEKDTALNKAVRDEPDTRLVELLLRQGASPRANGCQSLVDAAHNLSADVLEVLLRADIPESDLSWTLKQCFAPATATTWLSNEGHRIARLLLEKGAGGEGIAVALSEAIDAHASGSEASAAALHFIELLVPHVDVNQENGLVLQRAAKLGDPELIEQILNQKPNSLAVSMAFPYVFDSGLGEDGILHLVALFADYRDGEERLDVMFPHPESSPALFRAIALFPRSVKIVEALLDAGFYHDQMTTAVVTPETEEEEDVSLLLWAILQPQKRVSDGVMELLVRRGAEVNFETSLSKSTPLMLAVQHRRKEVVKTLLLAGADVDVTDATGNTPLTMATRVGGDLGTTMMTHILAANPSRNDGSLHNAARELDLRAVQVLVSYGHDVDFPSPIHEGRSALAEVCLHAARSALSAAQEKQMEKVMEYLIEQGTDLSLHSDGKSALLLALESPDPLPTTRALLKVGMYQHVNKLFNQYTQGVYTYSPTQYVARVLPESDARPALLSLLRFNRAKDVYYASEGPQPEGAIGLPEELLRAERERKARLELVALESEDHKRSVARAREMAAVQDQILANRAEIEDARMRRRQTDELAAIRSRAAVEEEVFGAQMRRAAAERQAGLQHQQALTDAGVARARLLADEEASAEGRRQARMIAYEKEVARERTHSAKQLSDVRVREEETLDRISAASNARAITRFAEQRKLVDGQNLLASRLVGAGPNERKQIGFISGEVD